MPLGRFGEVMEVWRIPNLKEAKQVAGMVRVLGYKVLVSLEAGEKVPVLPSGHGVWTAHLKRDRKIHPALRKKLIVNLQVFG